MNVGYDVTPITTGAGGVARYTEQLASALTAAGAQLLPFALGRGPLPAPAGTQRLRVPLRLLHPSWRITGRPRCDRLIPGAAVMHVTDLVVPPTRLPLVLSIHDGVAINHPELHDPRNVSVQRAQFAAAGRADIVIASSQATAVDVERAGVAADRIRVIPLGVSALPAPSGRVVEGDYFLAVGDLSARKNVALLAAAFEAATFPTPTRLVLVGAPGHGSDAITGRESSRVMRLGRLPDSDLATLYAHALGLCFPSRAEGFGLPVIEAMAAGTPVICSDIPVLREVGAQHVLYADPDDRAAWTAALELLAGDATVRARLRVDGIAHAAGYTWQRTATLTLAAYADAQARHAAARNPVSVQ